MDERFASALGDAFPEREITETTEHRPVANERNGTVSVKFDDGERVFCKIAVDGNGSRLDTDRAVIEYVDAHTDVMVPSVLACDPEAPIPYLVTAPVAGESLSTVKADSNDSGEAAVMRALGRTLANIHTLRFKTHGDITGGDATCLEIDSGSWTEVFIEHVRGIREFAHSDRVDRYMDDVVVAIEANREALDAAPATLVHDDPHGGNCRYNEGSVGLLGWEHAHVDDPARDLHRVREQQFGLFRPDDPDHQVVALHEGYREQAERLPDGFEERVPIYEVVRLLGASAFFESKADSCEESRAEVADWMDTEMEHRLEMIR